MVAGGRSRTASDSEIVWPMRKAGQVGDPFAGLGGSR
jgi:hypothetical protein